MAKVPRSRVAELATVCVLALVGSAFLVCAPIAGADVHMADSAPAQLLSVDDPDPLLPNPPDVGKPANPDQTPSSPPVHHYRSRHRAPTST